jgi:hypothetical protein
MKLVIKFPSRNRPEKFKQILTKYISLLSGKHEVSFIITLDEDDSTMNTPKMRMWLDELAQANDIQYFYGNSKSKVEACNANMDGAEGDVLLLISDDMFPVQEDYDDIIYRTYQNTFPDYDGAIKFNDGIRKDPLMTLPCLGWKLYERFGYIYHPDYTSVFCDNEQTSACMLMGKFAVSDICIAKHLWIPGNHDQADELHQRNDSGEMYEKDGKVFEERKNNNFGVLREVS